MGIHIGYNSPSVDLRFRILALKSNRTCDLEPNLSKDGQEQESMHTNIIAMSESHIPISLARIADEFSAELISYKSIQAVC
ncbi:Hypothetical protein NTJ_15626 [Nesidiocoris tenuis]|uniref:Uncharacterized protein n=1 Tax=Nesidiocoris tenuis TaxID=355587 RepID=A0ABN7BEL4_9HEMI|nr:Hypothetical protein NTJ_15626 [Nesidiocoris tenuis]